MTKENVVLNAVHSKCTFVVGDHLHYTRYSTIHKHTFPLHLLVFIVFQSQTHSGGHVVLLLCLIVHFA